MWPIVLCSVISIAIIFNKFIYFYRIRVKIPNLFSRVKHLLKDNKSGEALKLCETASDPVSHLLAIAIHTHKRSLEERERIIAMAGSKMIRKMDKNLRALAIIGNVTPLLGLLGTVTGMIRAFIKIQELGGRVDASVLAGGIWEALITTAAGLSVAIPAIVAYNYFEGRVENTAGQMKETASEFIDLNIHEQDD